MNKPIIIAEIGCNHMGAFQIAQQMVKTAKECGADFVKFQKRHLPDLMTPEEYISPHPVQENSFGETYGVHRKFLELPFERHQELKPFCEDIGIKYSCSVWDLTSAKQIASLEPEHIKIPSACNLNFEMLEYLCNHYRGEIIVSVGMTDRQEEEEIVSFFEKKGRNKDLILYSCTSGYPVPYEDVALLEILRLRRAFGHRVKSIGFSGHHLGTAVDIAATALGASHIERHFTLDRSWKGTDHAASLEPDDLRKLCKDVSDVVQSLNYKEQEILDIEKVQRDKLKRV